MPRLFSAIPLPDWAVDQIANLRGGLEAARWVAPNDYHITLAFFGDVDGRTADEIVSDLDRIYAAPCEIEVSGLGSFSRGTIPHNLHVDIRLNEALTSLRRDHERILRRHGFRLDRHGYHPHVTVARLNGRGLDTECASWLSERALFTLDTFTAHDFVLYSANDSVGGGPYVEEERFRLAARD